MIEKPFSPVYTNKLSETFPDLKQYILQNYPQAHFYKKGDEIPHVSEKIILYIKKGSIKSYICDESGEERLMYIFLEDSIVFCHFHSYFVKRLSVNESSEIYYAPRKDIMKFVQTKVDYIDLWTNIVSSRYGILLQSILSVNHCSSKHKVYSFIYQLALKYGKKNEQQYTIKSFPSYTDVASITGVHRSNATTYINELQSQDVLKKEKNTLVIYDLDLLKSIIDSLDSCKN